MSILNYIIWNGSPEIFTIGPVTLRWYGLLFALGFLISQQILYYIYNKEGKPEDDVNTLTIYMVVATILGARLGHVIFYQPEIIWQDPLGILLPFNSALNSSSQAFRGWRVMEVPLGFYSHCGSMPGRRSRVRITFRCLTGS